MIEDSQQELTRILDDFKVKDAKKLKENHEFLQNLSNMFDEFYKFHEKKIKTIKANRKMYESDLVNDYYGEGDGTSDGNRHLFKGSILSESARQWFSFLLKENPIWQSDTFAVDGFKRKLVQRIPELINNQDDPWVKDELEKREIIVVDQEQQRTPVTKIEETNLDSAKEFFDDVVDQNLDFWFKHDMTMPETKQVVAVDAYLCGEGMAQVRIVDEKPGAWPGTGPHIILEPFPPENFIEDPEANNIADVSVQFCFKILETKEIARLYDIDEKEITPFERFSEKYSNTKNVKDEEEKNYRIKKAMVVRAFIKDDTKISVPELDYENIPIYPNGREITFIPMQDSQSGIIVLDDSPQEFVGGYIHKFIPDPISQIRGRIPASDIINIANIADEAMQQGIANLKAMGNYKVFYEEGADLENLSDTVGEKVMIPNVNGVSIQKPQAITQEATNLFLFLKRSASEILGVNDVGEGKMPSNVTSGRALQILNSRINQIMALSVNHYATFLRNVGLAWLSAFLIIAKKGHKIIYNGEWHTLTFDLDEFIFGGDMFVSSETIIPRDPVAQSNMIVSIADMRAEDGGPMITRERLLKALRIDDAELIQKEAEAASGMQKNMQQLMQQNEMFMGQIEQLQAALEQATTQADQAVQKQRVGAAQAAMRAQSEQMKQEFMTLRQRLDDQAELQKANMESQTKLLQTIITAKSQADSREISKGGPVATKQ